MPTKKPKKNSPLVDALIERLWKVGPKRKDERLDYTAVAVALEERTSHLYPWMKHRRQDPAAEVILRLEQYVQRLEHQAAMTA